MRIGSYDLQQIRGKIVGDIYKALEDVIEKRKIRIAQQNRDFWLEPFKHLIDQLPAEIITRCKEYYVRVKYTPPERFGIISDIGIDEKWAYRTDSPVVNPIDGSSTGYGYATENTLHPKLQDAAYKLCDDILKLKKERTELEQYLYKTTKNNQGSIKLRKVWPEHLHKYLPAEPIKIGKKAKPIIQNPDVPTFLKERLTTNLLEDN
jgi:hypothetical protein